MKALNILWFARRLGVLGILGVLGVLGILPAGAATPVLVLNDANEAPYTTASRDGYVDMIAIEAFRRAGLSLRLVKQPAERGLRNADSGDLDGDLTRIAGLEAQYPNLVRVPEKLLDWEFSAFGAATSRAPQWEALGARPVAHIRGWKIYEKQLVGAAAVTAAADARQLFRLLATGRIESALYERWMGLAYLRESSLQGYVVHEPPLAKREMFIYLHKRHAHLVPALTKALVEMKAAGFYQRAYAKRLAPYLTPGSK